MYTVLVPTNGTRCILACDCEIPVLEFMKNTGVKCHVVFAGGFGTTDSVFVGFGSTAFHCERVLKEPKEPIPV